MQKHIAFTALFVVVVIVPVAVASCAREPLHGNGSAGEGERATTSGEGEGVASAGEGEGATIGGEGEGAIMNAGEGEGEGAIAPRLPPPLPTYSQGACPILVGGATKDTSVVTGFPTTSGQRQFRLLVPASYDGSQPMALMFAWHWLNADSGSFVDQGELETAIEQFPFIIVLPDKLRLPNGNKAYQFDWPFVETWGAPSEVDFFNDLLACVTQQYNIDDNRIYGVGVSAGGLWMTYLSTQPEADHFAAIESLSGGLGSFAYNGTGWTMQYQPQANKFPAIVLWGGDTDWLGISFKDASIAYRDALVGDGHFVVQCIHDQGHAVPPLSPPPGTTRFAFLWQFMMDHPYATPPGTSPWQQSGLPALAPSWCTILTP